MERREFVGVLGAAVAGSTMIPASAGARFGPTVGVRAPVDEWRRHFPALRQTVNGRPLTYLDTAATSLRPNQVIDAVADFYRSDNANPGGALHWLARRSNERYEGARRAVARFINATDPMEIVFTRGTTDGINLVASAWGGANLKTGDQILIGRAEHASNMVPWQLIARKTGAEVRYFGVDEQGRPLLDELAAGLSARTRVVAFSHVSNVLGVINPARDMCALARGQNRIVVVDGAQSVPHIKVDVRDLGCDFLAFSSHKMLGPMGVGVLWGRRDLLDAMPPYQGGSNMAHEVDLDSLSFSEGALKFGAGTPNVSGPVGLQAAIAFLDALGRDALWKHEQEITRHMLARLSRVRGVRVLGPLEPEGRIAVVSFVVDGKAPTDVLKSLDERGIAIRAGDLAALPLLMRYGVTRAARASAYVYTSESDVDAFADALDDLVRNG
jgi:cysteine desulfurase/selenocysteine lyase